MSRRFALKCKRCHKELPTSQGLALLRRGKAQEVLCGRKARVGAMVFTKEQCEAAVERSLRTSRDPCLLSGLSSDYESFVSLSVCPVAWSVGQQLANEQECTSPRLKLVDDSSRELCWGLITSN